MAEGSWNRVALAAIALALLVASAGIALMSDVALSADAPRPWAGGDLVVADEPVAAALFDGAPMFPGRPEVRCVVVRYDGDADVASLRLYARDVGGGLAPFLDVRVETGPDCGAATPMEVLYGGTLADLPRAWDEARPAWRPARGERLGYRFTVTLRRDERARDLEAGASLLWEARPAAAGLSSGGSTDRRRLG